MEMCDKIWRCIIEDGEGLLPDADVDEHEHQQRGGLANVLGGARLALLADNSGQLFYGLQRGEFVRIQGLCVGEIDGDLFGV